MSNSTTSRKALSILKYVVGVLLIAIGIMGGLEALVNLWSFRGIPSINFFIIAYQVLWGIGNAALLLIGLLYFYQGSILSKHEQLSEDIFKYNKSNFRANSLIVIAMIIALVILFMNYLSARELVEFINNRR